MNYFKKLTVFLSLLCFVNVNAAENITIGIISDGENAQTIIDTDFQQSEIQKLLEPQYQVEFIELNGGWDESQINQVLRKALANNNIDLILTTGLVGTHIAGKTENLGKPVIGSFVPDPVLQEISLSSEKTSGKNNYTYMSSLQSFSKDMEDVFAILPGDKFAIISDKLIFDGVPMLASRAFYEGQDVKLFTATDSVEDAINQLPDDLDALLVAPLLRFSKEDMQIFSNELIKRNIASVSFVGAADVRQGLLLSVGSQPSDALRIARRVALNVMSILDGDNAGDLPVSIQWSQSIQYNSDTARAIGFELPWEMALLSEEFRSVDSDTIRQEKLSGMSLQDAVSTALNNNLGLEINRLNLDIATTDLLTAKSSWWPQLTANAQLTQLDSDITSAANPEGTIDGGLGLKQLIYSERAKSGLDIARLNEISSQHDLDTIILDTISNVSTAYLSVQRTQALEGVQSSQLRSSVQNLDLSENRFKLGAVTETDVLRWKNQIATDKQNLLSAQANLRNAIVNLQTLLHQPIALNIVFDDTDTKLLIQQVLSDESRKIFDTPSLRNTMQTWMVERALLNSPELQKSNISLTITKRNSLAEKRAFYVPDVSLSGQYNNNFNRYGDNSTFADSTLPNNSWNVSVVASYPIFNGRARQASLAKAKHQERQALLSKYVQEDTIKSNVWTAWNKVGFSYPAIVLSKEGAQAAKRNLELIRDQYSSGSINITTLIDAQNSALASQLAAAQAEYAYLIDMVSVMRSISDFRFLTETNHGETWFKEFNEYQLKQEFRRGIK